MVADRGKPLLDVGTSTFTQVVVTFHAVHHFSLPPLRLKSGMDGLAPAIFPGVSILQNNHKSAPPVGVISDSAVLKQVLSRALVSLGFQVIQENVEVRQLKSDQLAIEFHFVVRKRP